jgi:hypothetical protein
VPEPPYTAGNSSREWLGAGLTVDEVCGSQVIAGMGMVQQSTRDTGEGEEGDVTNGSQTEVVHESGADMSEPGAVKY